MERKPITRKNSKNEEVDFVLKEGIKANGLMQVCMNLDNEETKKRKIRSLLSAMEELELGEGLMITDNHEAIEEIKGKNNIHASLEMASWFFLTFPPKYKQPPPIILHKLYD